MAAAGNHGTTATATSTVSSHSLSASSNHWTGSAFDELRWVIQIRHTLDEEQQEEDEDAPVSVFNVPKALLQTKPDAYVPQLIALGPYHHWRAELYEMERYKLSAAKRTQKTLPSGKLQDIVDAFKKHDNRVRAHYHRYLDFGADTLAWMMAVDTCFLLEFIQVYAVDEDGRALRRVSSRMSHLVDMAGRRSAHNIILRDVMMMENQVPLFLLRKILNMQNRKVEGDALLANAVTGFMKELSPFKMLDNFPTVDVHQHAHLLEVLYYVLVPNCNDLGIEVGGEIDAEQDINNGTGEGDGSGNKSNGDSSYVKELFSSLWGMGSSLNAKPVHYLKKAITSKPVTFIVKAPWKLLTAVPGLSILKQPVEYFVSSAMGSRDAGKAGGGDLGANSSRIDKPPSVEEITIPSVEELVNAGVRFCPTNGDLTTIYFDPKTITFNLPVITLDVNSNVVLRNLVAYEASVAAGPLVLARYTELMNGIIDTDEDVKLLRQSGVLFNHMKSDADVANLWNGMSKSIRLTKVPFMDKAIEDINHYHSSRWRVKTGKFMKKYIFGSWPFLTFLAAVLLLLLTALQAFCSVYSCVRWFHVPVVQQQG